jgi:hypothetical protein
MVGWSLRPSVLDGGDVGRVDGLHADDVVARIDMVDLAGDGAGEIGEEIEAGVADLLGGDGPLQGRVQLVPFEDVAEVTDAGGGKGLDRAGRDTVDADVSRAALATPMTL